MPGKGSPKLTKKAIVEAVGRYSTEIIAHEKPDLLTGRKTVYIRDIQTNRVIATYHTRDCRLNFTSFTTIRQAYLVYDFLQCLDIQIGL